MADAPALDEEALAAMVAQFTSLGEQMATLTRAAYTLQEALNALAAVWALDATDMAPGIYAAIYESDDEGQYAPHEDPTALDAGQAVLTRVWATIAEHIDPNTFTRKD